MTGAVFFRRFERIAIVATPIVALTTVAVALWAGASSRSTGALVYGAAPAEGRSGIAFQIMTLANEAGVREVVSVREMQVVASSEGHVATWHGGTNPDGIAEVWLDLPEAPRWGTPITMTITAADGEVLAQGPVTWPPFVPWVSHHDDAAIPATRREGDLQLNVYIAGGRLPPGFATPVLVLARGPTGEPMREVQLTALPEPGLSVLTPTASTNASGWAEFAVTADYLLAGWTVEARSAAPGGPSASWFGALPVAPGGAFVSLPSAIPIGRPYRIDLVLPAASPWIYVEVDDEHGRDFGAAEPLERSSRGAVAQVELPPLAAGRYWLVTSVDPRGALTLAGSTLARPFRVGSPAAAPEPTAASLAFTSPPPFTRFLALDGMAGHRLAGAARRGRGLAAALASLAVAACLEVLLVLRAAQRAKTELRQLSEAGGVALGAAFGTQTVAVFVLVSLLGFALIAALLLVRAG